MDEMAARAVLNGRVLKSDLSPETNPFKKTFGIGVNFEGYWNHHQMSVQFEDVHDVVSIMYPNVEIEYYFDHSSCHDKMLEDGLNANSMNQKYAGEQPHMRDTVVPTVGPHSPKLAAGDTQTLVFHEGDHGPHYENEEQ